MSLMAGNVIPMTLETVSDIDEMVDIANECKALLNQLIIITKDNQKLSQDDFITKKKP